MSILTNSLFAKGENPVKVDILSDWDGVSEKFTLGVRFSISPGWYVYWQNPGDAGLAPEIKLTSSTSLKTGEILFPVPKKIVHENIISFGYYNEVVLLIPVQFDSKEFRKKRNVIKAQINWLVCKESCVPGKVTLEYVLKKATPKEISLIKKYKDMLPKKFEKSGLEVKNFSIDKKGNSRLIRIELFGENVKKIQDFYPYPLDKFLIDLNSIKLKDGRIEVMVTPTMANAEMNFFGGLVVINGESYELKIKTK
ncbi:MAG: protein-disulfide reductase DsbD domain-containing protein [Candidatus Kryptonium sp.]